MKRQSVLNDCQQHSALPRQCLLMPLARVGAKTRVYSYNARLASRSHAFSIRAREKAWYIAYKPVVLCCRNSCNTQSDCRIFTRDVFPPTLYVKRRGYLLDTRTRARGLPLTEISYTSAEISNEILKSPAKSEIFREIPKSLKSLPKSAKS